MFALDSTTIFIFGFALAAVNYYLGLFLGSLPLPKRIRSVGWGMVEDSATYAVLLVICATPPIVLQIFSTIGFGNIDALYQQTLYPWIGVGDGLVLKTGVLSLMLNGFVQMALILLTLMLASMLIQAGLRNILLIIQNVTITIPDAIFKLVRSISTAVGGVLGVYISYRAVQYAPFLSLIPLSWFSLYAVYYLAEFIRAYWPSMMGLGALIFGIPFRIGRRVGTALIAISLVFYLGLPLMPYFVEPAARIDSAAESVRKLQAELQEATGAVGLWQGPSTWPTTQDDPFNMTYETREWQPSSSVGTYWGTLNQLFSIVTGSGTKNLTDVNPTLDPPEYVKRVAVPEGLAEFTFYTLLLPNIYIWVILATIAAGLAKVLAGKGYF
jgi:hypothetical protein